MPACEDRECKRLKPKTVENRQGDMFLCDDCNTKRFGPPVKSKKQASNNVPKDSTRKATKDDGIQMDLAEASRIVYLTHDKAVDAMNLQHLRKFDTEESRQIIQAALTSILPSTYDATTTANESANIATKLKKHVDARMTTLSADQSLSPMTFAERIMAASPLRATRPAPTSSVTAPTRVACLENCSLNHQIKGKPIECCLCNKEFHTQCVGLNASGKRPTWFCHSCKDIPSAIKRLQDSSAKQDREQQQLKCENAQLKRENAELKAAVKSQAELLAQLTESKEASVANDTIGDDVENPATLIIGDSIIKDFNEKGLRNTQVSCIRGGKIEDIERHLADKDPSNFKTIIIHGGTNNCTDDNDLDNVPKVYENMIRNIKGRAPGAEIVLSTVLPRADSDKNQERVDKLNTNFKGIGQKQGIKVIDNDVNFKLSNQHPDEGSLNGSKLHLNNHGTRKLLNNFDKTRPIIKASERRREQSHRPSKNAAPSRVQQPHTSRPFRQPRGTQHRNAAPSRSCFYCGGTNHVMKNCHFGKQIQCHTCGEYGHKSNNRHFHPAPAFVPRR